jgi:CP family cyanate transporter-like MFS transporter
MDRDPRSAVRRPALLLFGLLIAAATTRPQLVGVGPLLNRIQHDLGISHASAGLLGTVPVFCMGLFAPFGPRIIERLGAGRGVGLCIALIAVGGLVRSSTNSYALMLLFTFLIGAGMGAIGSAMPVVVAGMRHGGRAVATGIYVTGINVGAAASSAVAVPLADSTHGWRGSLAIISGVSALLLGGWLWAARRAGIPAPAKRRSTARRRRRDRRSWLLVLLFTSMAVCYYGAIAWLADAYVERGWTAARAGALVAIMNLVSLVGALAAPWLAKRFGSRRSQLLAVSTIFALGFVLLAAGSSLAWAGAVLVGVGNGGLFVLVLLLPLDFAETESEVGALASAMLAAGYMLAAVAPVLLGGIRDLTGSFDFVLWPLAASAAVFMLTSQLLFRVASRPSGDVEVAPAQP